MAEVGLSVHDRALTALDLRTYDNWNLPDEVGPVDLVIPDGRTYVLRMLIRRPGDEGYLVPDELSWVAPLLPMAESHQQQVVKVRHPFQYLTIRSGLVDSETDDQWHVDGFSLRFNHLPEQNYFWCDSDPTEYIVHPVQIPPSFDPLKHNIHFLFQDVFERSPPDVRRMRTKVLYCFDPYVVHRRPVHSRGQQRTFVRISHLPIELNDVHDARNPLMGPKLAEDRVSSFRNQLTRP